MILGIVQARVGSSRFPNKIFERVGGSSMLGHVIERAAQCVNALIVATPPQDRDTISAWFGNQVMVVGHGEENDVLSRFHHAAKFRPDADTIVRFTGDCPMLDIGVSRDVIGFFEAVPAKQTNIPGIVSTSGDLDGLDTEVFTRWALDEAYKSATGPDREHVTVWMKHNLFSYVVSMPDFPPIRWSVDDREGLAFVRRVFQACIYCQQAIPHHTNAIDSIGGGRRRMVLDLHVSTGGGLVECLAADILKERQGPQWRYTSSQKPQPPTTESSPKPGTWLDWQPTQGPMR